MLAFVTKLKFKAFVIEVKLLSNSLKTTESLQ